jgi:MFS family permease
MLWGQHTFRHMLIASTVLYLFGCGLVQWLPVFFIRLHGMSTGELGTWMAINWGAGNAIGTFAGGYLTRRGAVAAERRQLEIMALIACVFVPIYAVVLLAPDAHVAMVFMFIGALVNALATAPSFALIQTLVPDQMRATAVATIFLFANLIGLGLGPLLVGLISDSLSRVYGANSLRIALLACTPGYWWVAAHFYKASRTVMADLSQRESDESKLIHERQANA